MTIVIIIIIVSHLLFKGCGSDRAAPESPTIVLYLILPTHSGCSGIIHLLLRWHFKAVAG